MLFKPYADNSFNKLPNKNKVWNRPIVTAYNPLALLDRKIQSPRKIISSAEDILTSLVQIGIKRLRFFFSKTLGIGSSGEHLGP